MYNKLLTGGERNMDQNSYELEEPKNPHTPRKEKSGHFTPYWGGRGMRRAGFKTRESNTCLRSTMRKSWTANRSFLCNSDFISWCESHLETQLLLWMRDNQRFQLFLHGNVGKRTAQATAYAGRALATGLTSFYEQQVVKCLKKSSKLATPQGLVDPYSKQPTSRLPITSESFKHMFSSQPSSGGDSGRNTQSAPQAKALTKAK